MPRFSIIIPVYNTGKYLKKCFDSVFKQDYKDYEVIIINDGSTDNSEKIINKYIKKHKNIIYISQENQGLSVSRNNGVLKATGEYLLFLDSDDFYEKGFLKKLSDRLDDCDVIRFQVQDVYDDGNVVRYSDPIFPKMNGVDAFNLLCSCHYVEIACAYCYKRDFWIKNSFKFLPGTYHEDFGLIPLVLLKSGSTKCVDILGYNYYNRLESITNSGNYSKIRKKASDFLIHFDILKKEGSSINGDLSIFYSYIANSVIIKSTTLRGKDYKEYVLFLKNNGAFDMLLDDSVGRKIKKFFVKISPKIYYKIVRR